jgi:16S rRNA (cytosine967-C5)-methyltransferase
MKDSGTIKAMDRQAWKLKALEASMRRLGVSNVATWHYDLSAPMGEDVADMFDRILVDAPCSGLGVVRRRPDIKWRKQEKDLARLQRKQENLLASLAPLVKRGGWLVYSVCSLEPEEGEQVVDNFLKTQTDFVIDDSSTGLAEMDEGLVDGSGIFRSLPHKHDMDGFFAVRLKKGAA